VVSAAGGPTHWLDIAGDPQSYYLARMDWAVNSQQLVVQRLNRRQDRDDLLLGDARTGRVHVILTERDTLSVDVVNDLRWLDRGRAFTWVSDRDGWRHLYVVSRDGRTTRLITQGPFDLVNPDVVVGEHLVVGSDDLHRPHRTPHAALLVPHPDKWPRRAGAGHTRETTWRSPV
jgi:hypothetical protein